MGRFYLSRWIVTGYIAIAQIISQNINDVGWFLLLELGLFFILARSL
jgi:hypothetical protein